MIINLELEIYKEEEKTKVFLSHNGSSGCSYPVKDIDQLKEIIHDYIDDAIDEVDYDRRAVEKKYNLEDGELDDVFIREAEKLIGLEDGELDRFIIFDKEEDEE